MNPKFGGAHPEIMARRKPTFYFYELLPDKEKKEKIRSVTQWQKNNPKKHNESVKRWQRKNPEKLKEYRKRLAKKQGFKDVKAYDRYRWHKGKKVKG